MVEPELPSILDVQFNNALEQCWEIEVGHSTLSQRSIDGRHISPAPGRDKDIKACFNSEVGRINCSYELYETI
jgi:hypothetical protein